MGSANFYTEVITYSNTEIAFVKNIKAYITGLDSRITCPEDPDYEYDRAERGDSYVPKFNFYINNKLIFIIQRAAALPNGVNGFSFIVKKNDETLVNQFIQFGNMSVQGYLVARDRSFYISHVISDNFILIDFHQNFSSWGDRPGVTVLYAKSDDSEYVTYNKVTSDSSYTKANVFDISSVLFNGITEAVSGTFISRFSYKSVPGKIDYVISSVYATAGQKQFDIKGIYNCTTVTVGEDKSLSDGSYIAVGPNQLVKISDS